MSWLASCKIDFIFLRFLITVNMSTVGLGHGVFHHFFYGWIDRTFPGTSLRNVVRKIFVDQLIASPVCMYIFFIGMAIMERRGYESGWQEIKNKFLFCYMVSSHSCSIMTQFQNILLLFVSLLRLTGLFGLQTNSLISTSCHLSTELFILTL